MKTNSEVFDLVMARKDEYEKQKAARNKRIAAAGAGVLAIALCVGVGVAALKGGTPPVKAGGEDNTDVRAAEPDGSAVEQTAVTRPDDPTISEDSVVFPPYESGEAAWNGNGEPAQTTKIYGGANVPDGAGFYTEETEAERGGAPPKDDPDSPYGGDTQSGGRMIPARPDASGAEAGVKAVGEKITDAEASAYLRENTWIGSALAAGGVSADDITYSETGYCHVSYDGTEGKPLEVRENFRDYLAYSGGRLIAIITVTKENGKLSATPAFGGPWFPDYDAFLKAHKGQKLLYVYAGWMEIIITPDGKCYNPQGSDVSAYMEGLENPYAYFYSEAAAYTP